MKKTQKLGLLFLTLAPVIIIPFFIFMIIGGGIGLGEMNDPSTAAPLYVGSIVFWAIIIGLLSTISWIYFIVHAIQNNHIDQTEKIVWVLLFVFVGLLSQIIYFFARIWSNDHEIKENKFTEIQYS